MFSCLTDRMGQRKKIFKNKFHLRDVENFCFKNSKELNDELEIYENVENKLRN